MLGPQGHLMVPWYLNEGIDWTDNAVRLVVDENDNPIFQNYQPINFTARSFHRAPPPRMAWTAGV